MVLLAVMTDNGDDCGSGGYNNSGSGGLTFLSLPLTGSDIVGVGRDGGRAASPSLGPNARHPGRPDPFRRPQTSCRGRAGSGRAGGGR